MNRLISKVYVLVAIAMVTISACNLSSENSEILSITSFPTNVPSQTTPNDNGEIFSSDWEVLAVGLERRTYTPEDVPFGEITAVRIDPLLYRFRAHYQAGDPLTLTGWRETLGDPVVIINANFFTPEYRVLGLLIADGVAYGTPYTDRGGWFGVQDGEVFVRSNTVQPYQGEPLEQMAQAYPMLVLNGEGIFTNSQGDRATRRTIIAQDVEGRIILMVTPLLGMSLVDLSAYLPTTDMNIVNAFNFDGGGSTMMYLEAGTEPYIFGGFDSVPAVLAVYPR